MKMYIRDLQLEVVLRIQIQICMRNYYFECEIGNAMMKGIANESVSLDSYKINMGASFKYRF